MWFLFDLIHMKSCYAEVKSQAFEHFSNHSAIASRKSYLDIKGSKGGSYGLMVKKLHVIYIRDMHVINVHQYEANN